MPFPIFTFASEVLVVNDKQQFGFFGRSWRAMLKSLMSA